MSKKAERRRKEKNPVHLKAVRQNVETEISILCGRLEQGDIPSDQVHFVESRICILMNQTLPKIEERLGAAQERLCR